MANTTVSVTLAADVAKFQADMQRAGASTQQAMSQMQRAANATRTALAGLALNLAPAVMVGAYANAVKGVADYADEMGKMSQKVGVAVEQLSGLTYAASLSDVSNEALGLGLKKLSKLMQEAAGGMEQQKRILKELGVTETQDANEAFLQLADRFASMEEGAGKTAAAMAVFGKSGADLLPLMNQGAEGIRAATTEAERFGLVVGKDAAEAAEKFNDNLTRLAALIKGAQTSIFGDLIIGLGNATQAYIDGAREGSKYLGIQQAIQTLFTGDERHKNNVQLSEDTEKLLRAENALAGARASNRPQVQIDARQKLVDDLKERIKLTLNYKKVLDEQDAKPPAPAKTGTVDPRIFGTGDKKGKSGKSDAEKIEEDAKRFVARLKEQAEAYGKTGAALLEYQLAQSKMPQRYKDEALALQTTIDGLKAKDDHNKKSIAADIAGFKEMDELRKADEAAQKQTQADVEAIRIGLMSPADRQNSEHQKTLEQLQAFHDAKFENVALANQLIEEENARHKQSLADMQFDADSRMLGMVANSADQLYSLLKQAGQEQSALGKIAFFAAKALGVAQIILSTNVAAASALMLPPIGLGPVAGLPFAAFIKTMGYTSAALTAGLAIAGQREKGGNVWGGGAFLVGERGPEIFRPAGQGSIIPNSQIGAGSGGDLKLTIINNTSAKIGQVTEQRISPTERALIIHEANEAYSAQLADPNSKPSRSLSRNFAMARSR